MESELRTLIKQIHTSYPARIIDFEPETQTATVQLLIERYYSSLDVLNEFLEPLVLVDVPVHFPQSKRFCITFPVEAGDDCLVFFAEKGIEHWLYDNEEVGGLNEGGIPHPDHKTTFSTDSALALVGFNSIPNAIPNYNPVDFMIRSKDDRNAITISDDALVISRNLVEDEETEDGINRTVTPVTTVTLDDSGLECLRTNDSGTTSAIINDAGAEVNTTGAIKFEAEGNVDITTGGTLTLKAKNIAMIKG